MTWLEHLYGGEEIPEFEVNERTIEILHSLMVKNETKNRETQLVTDDLNQKTTEYTAEGVYLQLSHLSNSSHQCRFLSRLSNSSHQCRFLSRLSNSSHQCRFLVLEVLETLLAIRGPQKHIIHITVYTHNCISIKLKSYLLLMVQMETVYIYIECREHNPDKSILQVFRKLKFNVFKGSV